MVQSTPPSLTNPNKLRRSLLYMPGSNQRALEKAKSLDADGYIFDLEDAVAPAAKVSARHQVVAAAAGRGYGDREVVIRMNGLDTPWGEDDLSAIARSQAHAILIPKVESLTTVRRVEAALLEADVAQEMAIWCMLETPKGILQATDIAASSARVACLVMGTSDLTNELHAQPSPEREPMLTALSWCLLAARAHGKGILDGVHLDLADASGFAASCEQGRAFGFDGKTLIHPSQIAPCNQIFAPSADAVVQAEKIVQAYQEATAAGQGVVVVEGRLVENLHVKNAERILAQAAAIARRESQSPT